ncbi:MAG: Crp/Fnr family transcriptional regulator [Clostridia bacterium]|nr:Crp/Fnr family transcriptional regulator [Clostridia bacterium]
MEKYIPILKNTLMFRGVDEQEISAMLGCLGARLGAYKKGEYVIRQGEKLGDVSVLLSGELHIQNDDYWGNRSILSIVRARDTFGEAYLSPDSGLFPSDVIAAEDSEIMFFDVKRVLTTCSAACRFHGMVVQNVFYAVAEKNRSLVEKLGHMSKRTTKEKLISYLSGEAKRQNSSSFTIPFNRQQLADFLAVDRSAMSNELCKMRDEGRIEFNKNRFRLL